MIEQLKHFLQKHSLTNTHILLALSGGIDSIVLFHLLLRCKHEGLLHFSVCHINHQLRAESEEEEHFVLELCKKHSILYHIEKVDVMEFKNHTKSSLEMAAHTLRYQVFKRIAIHHNATAVFTAHHQEDQLETIFMRLVFGAGHEGIQGLAEQNGFYYKPLLNTSKNQICAYQKEHKLSYVEDISNTDESIPRNFWRHSIFPQIRSRFGDAYFKNVLKTIENINLTEHDNQLLETELAKIPTYVSYIQLSVSQFKGYLSFFQKKIIEKAVYKWFNVDININRTLLKMIHDIISSDEGGKSVELTSEIRCQTHKRILYIYRVFSGQNKVPLHFEKENFIGHNCVLAEKVTSFIETTHRNIEYIDAHCVKEPLYLRYTTDSDRFIPLGFSGTKSVKSFLKGQGVPPFLREQTPVLCSGEKVVWILGTRLDASFKVTEKTTDFIRLEVQER